MSNKVGIEFGSEGGEQEILRTLAKLVASEQSLRQELEKVEKAGGRAKKEISGFGNFAADAGKIALGIVGASSAMEIFSKAVRAGRLEFDELDRKMRESHEAATAFAGNFSQVISESFGTEKVDEIFERLKGKIREGKIPELGYESATRLIKAYKGARPEASKEETEKAVEMTAPMVQFGEAGKESLIKLAGELKQILPEKEMADVYDIAVTMYQRAGKFRDDLSESMRGVRQLQEWGVSGEEGLGLLMGMLGAEQQPRALTGMLNVIADESLYKVQGYSKKWGMKKVGTRYEKLTDEEQLKLSLRQKEDEGETKIQATAKRFRWILDNPEKAQELFEEKLGKIQPGLAGAKQGTEDIQKAQELDAYMKEYKAGLASKLVGEKREEVIRGEKIGALKIDVPDKFKAIGELRETLDTQLRSMPGIGAIESWMIKTTSKLAPFFGGDEKEAALWGLRRARNDFASPTRKYDTGLYSGEFKTTEYENPNYNPQAARQMEDLIGMIEKIQGTSTIDAEVIKANTETNKNLTNAVDDLTSAIRVGNVRSRPVVTGAMD